jgi:hypothetical protein
MRIGTRIGMKIDVVLSRRGKRYVAQAAGLPEIRVEGASRDAVLRGVEQRLRTYLDRVELVRMDMGEARVSKTRCLPGGAGTNRAATTTGCTLPHSAALHPGCTAAMLSATTQAYTLCAATAPAP